MKPGADLGLYSLELARAEAKEALARKAAQVRSRTEWLAEARYGLFFHWTSSRRPDIWRATCPRRGPRKPFPKNVEDFDLPAFVNMVRETGAGYIIFSTTWADHCFPAPIRAVDKILPGRTSKRDLVMELADGLARHGIRLMLYYHPGYGSDAEWWEATKGNFVDNWCAIMREAGRRYAEKLAGWWFDSGAAYYQLNVPFDRFAQAVKDGNPNRLISYNGPWFMPKLTDFQDYLAGEGPTLWLDQSLLRYLPKGGTGILTGGRGEGLHAQQSFPLEKGGWLPDLEVSARTLGSYWTSAQGWIHNKANIDIGPPIWDKDLLVTQMRKAMERKFAATMAIEVYQDGSVSSKTLELLKTLKNEIGRGSRG